MFSYVSVGKNKTVFTFDKVGAGKFASKSKAKVDTQVQKQVHIVLGY